MKLIIEVTTGILTLSAFIISMYVYTIIFSTYLNG